MFECILSVFCFHNQNRYFNGLKTFFFKFCSKVGGRQFKVQFSMLADILTKSGQNASFWPTLWPKSIKINELWPKFWSKSVTISQFQRKLWPQSVTIFPPHTSRGEFLAAWFWLNSRSQFGQTVNFDRFFRSKRRSNNFFDWLFGQKFDQTRFLTDYQSVKNSVIIFWPTGQKKISTNVFPTERCRSKFRSKCSNSVKIWGIFSQNFGHNQCTVL